ncbi:MAG: MFS transporter [Caldisericum sp.]|jgi:MFS family permease|uniref:MFS transporter n=1 Tax=Caldisericum sp. TaxID=2499687 RepID=UPI003D0B7C2A
MKYRLLREKSFFLYVFGQTVSVLGDGLYLIAIMWLILKITDNRGLAVGGAFSVFSIGELISGFIAGPIADNFNKKKILIITDFLRAIIVFLLYFLSTQNLINMFEVILILFILSILSPIFSTTQFTLIPLLVEKDELLEANGIITGITRIAQILAPSLGGILVALFGYSICFLIDAISFLVSVATIIFIRLKTTQVKEKVTNTILSLLESFKEGYKFLLSSKFLMVLSSYALVVNSLGGALQPLIPIFAEKYNFGSQGYGYMMSAFSLGFLVFALLTGFLPKKVSETHLMLYGLTLTSISLVLCGVFKSLIPVLILFFIIGLSNGLTNLPMSTLFQKIVKIELLGVVTSFVFTVGQALQPVSMLVSGYLTEKISVSTLFIFIGLFAMLLSLAGFAIPAFRMPPDTTGSELVINDSEIQDKG